MQNDMSIAVMLSKSKTDVEFQYGGRLGEFSEVNFTKNYTLLYLLPLCHPRATFHTARCGEFTVTILEPHATLQRAVTWRNQFHDRATLHGVRILSAILKIVCCHILFFSMQFRL